MSVPNPKLVTLFQQMADLTAPECAGVGPGSCNVPHSCCDPMYCEIARDYAKDVYGLVLKEQPPNERGVFFLGENGCTVAPYLRPLCSVHICKINALGCKPGDPKWTKKYFRLRRTIESRKQILGNFQ